MFKNNLEKIKFGNVLEEIKDEKIIKKCLNMVNSGVELPSNIYYVIEENEDDDYYTFYKILDNKNSEDEIESLIKINNANSLYEISKCMKIFIGITICEVLFSIIYIIISIVTLAGM